MGCSIVLRSKIILVCDTAMTILEKKSQIDYGFVVILSDVLVIVVLIVVILVVCCCLCCHYCWQLQLQL